MKEGETVRVRERERKGRRREIGQQRTKKGRESGREEHLNQVFFLS